MLNTAFEPKSGAFGRFGRSPVLSGAFRDCLRRNGKLVSQPGQRLLRLRERSKQRKAKSTERR